MAVTHRGRVGKVAMKTTVLPETLTSNGNAFDLSAETFGELRDANGLLGNAAALHERFAEDGYLLLRGYLDQEKVLAARRGINREARRDRPDRSHTSLYGVNLLWRYQRYQRDRPSSLRP